MRRLIAFTAALLCSAAALAQAPVVSGEVTKIDKPQARITLRHGEIRNLDMPAMSMVFRVADPRMLDNLTVGDKVRFTADKVGGNFTVTTISKAP